MGEDRDIARHRIAGITAASRIACSGSSCERMGEIFGLIGHRMGGRLGEYLMHRLGSPVSADTILRQLKRDNPAAIQKDNIRVLGIDDWSWLHSLRYGTVMVDLERHSVVMNAARMAGMGAMLSFSDPSVDPPLGPDSIVLRRARQALLL